MKDSSLRRMLATTTMVSLGTALLLVSVAFAVYELLAFRATMVSTLSTQAAIMARQSTSALVFRDPDSAKATLSALSAEPHVVSAGIFNPDGTLFASYVRSGSGDPPRLGPSREGYAFERGRLVLSRGISFDNAPIGTVVIESDLDEMTTRLERYALIVAAVMAVSFLLAYLTANRLQRALTGPILHLAATAQTVSNQKDYSVRAVGTAQGELGLLLHTFNHMLDQIQDQDAALQQARDHLERQVEERTEQLRQKNKELEEQSIRVQQATRLKSEFLANMSHELRTPLNAIIGFAELIHDGRVGPVAPQQKECLADILTSSRHLLQLINDVLDLSKVEAGKMEFRPETISLPKVVGEVRDILRTLSARKRIVVNTDFEPGLDAAVLDPGKFKQILYNYLSNALKFTPEGGRVTIRTRLEDADHFRIEVEDSGVGIRPEDLARLFVEFQQLDASSAKSHQGTGLGLALTKRIVEAQGGRVGVMSNVGQGSLFYAVLPRAARSLPPVAERTEPAANESAGSGPTILVIEDDDKERAWLKGVLAAHGYQVDEAVSGQEAISRCRARAYDAITLDLFLPDGTGWDILGQIRRSGPNQATPVIVVTVVAEKNAGTGYAIHDYLIKPVQEEQLLASLNQAGLAPQTGRTILVVDDDAGARKLASTILNGMGYRVLAVSNAEDGLRTAEKQGVGAVILDLLMPGMDGLAFLEHFRRLPQGRGTPVIVWTAKDLTFEDRRQLAATAQGIVLKSDGGAAALLDELRHHGVPPPAAKSPGADDSQAPPEQAHGR